jgi:sec-independent protein translocase protein TatA
MGLENPLHILILLVVVLLVFGAKRLPEMGHSLGSGMRGFKDALSGAETHVHGLGVAPAPEHPLSAVAASATPAPAPSLPAAPPEPRA